MTTSRRLHFVVGTSLLGASLSLGCTSKCTPDQDLHVNPGPEPDAPQPEPKPEPDNVNVGPVDEPDAEPTTKTVNTRPNN